MNTIGMQQNWYIQFVLTLLVLAIPGRRFYEKGFPALVRLGPDMNSLVAVGTMAAFGFSMVATFAPGLLTAQGCQGGGRGQDRHPDRGSPGADRPGNR